MAAFVLLSLALPPTAASQALRPELSPSGAAVGLLPSPAGESVYQAACTPRPRVAIQSEKIGEKDFRVTVTAGQGNLELLRFGNAPNTRIDLPVPSPQSGGGLVPPFDFKPPAAPSYTFVVRSTGAGAPITVPITIFDGCGMNHPWNTFVGGGQSATLVQVSIADASVTEGDVGTQNANFVVSLSSPPSVPVTVAWATQANASATAQDFVAASGVLTFVPGETSKPILIQIVGDLLDEPNKTFTVQLTNPTNATIGDGTATGTIIDNEGAPGLTVDDVTLAEGNAGTTAFTFAVSLTSPSGQPISVQYATQNDTAVAGADYTATSGTLSFAPGEVSKPVVIQVTGETVFEANERFFVNLSNPTNAGINRAQGNGTIANDDAQPSVTVSMAPSSFSENGGTTTVTATLSNPSSLPVTVDVGFGGSATAPPAANHDFTLAGPAQITVPATQLSGTLVLTAVNDAVFEGDEVVQATIANPVNATLGATTQASATITENETVPTVSLSVSPSSFAELNGTTDLTATLTGTVDEQVTVTVALTGTASNTDYRVGLTSPAPATVDLVIPAFATSASVTLTGIDDTDTEGDETVIATIQTVTGGGVTGSGPPATATITDDDAPRVTLVLEPGTTFGENGGTVTVRANLSVAPPAGLPATINFNFAGAAVRSPGTDADYTASATQIVISNPSTTGTITLTGIDDDIYEGGTVEDVVVTLGTLVNAADPAPAESVTATITDADVPPSASLSLANSPFVENLGTATVTATLNRRSTQTVTVNLALSGTATVGTDYSISSAAITVSPLSTAGTATLTGIVDAVSEGNETIVVDIDTVTNGTEGVPNQVTATITDDDLPTVSLSFDGADPVFMEASGTRQVTATLSNTWPDPVTVNLAYSGQAIRQDGVAANPDYTGALQIVVPANTISAFITLTALEDTIREIQESVIVDITSVVNGTESGTQTLNLAIADNDPNPTVTLTDNDADDLISEAGGTVTLTISLSNPMDDTITVTLAYTGTALNPADYTRNPDPGTTFTFNPLETTKTVILTAVNDTTFEGDKTIVVDIDAIPTVNAIEGTPNQVTITIDEDDPPPTAFLTVVPASPSNISETGGSATITANLTSSVTTDTTVTLAINGTSTATDPADYIRTASLDLVIPAGTLTSSTGFTITAASDALDENDETVIVDIATVTGGITEGAPNTVTVTILDDDDPPTIAWTGSNPTVTEGDPPVTATAQLSAPSGKTITIQVAVTGSATNPADYTRTPAAASPFTLTFTAGDTSEDVVVTIVDDTTAGEVPDETVILTLQTPSNVTIGSPATRTITIQDNDPDAVNDTYAATGNMQLTVPDGAVAPCGQTDDLLCNDFTVPTATSVTTFGPNAGTQVSPGAASTTAQGGNLTVQANGSFVYNPPAGFTGADTFVYFLGTDSATVTINVDGDSTGDNLVWFVDENAATDGDGRFTTPFNSLASFNNVNDDAAANHPKNDDYIFLYESTDPYVGPVTLRNGQTLVGQDATTTLAAITGITVPAGSATFPTTNTGGGTVTVTASGATAITLGSGNTLRGFTLGNVGAAGNGIAGTSFGTLTFAASGSEDVTVNTNGRALNLDTGTVNGALASLTSSGGTNNVRLDTIAGTFNMGSGALSGASGPALLIGDGGTTANAGGTIALTYSGTIEAGSGRTVDIQDRAAAAGAIALSGAVTGSATQSTIFLDDNATGTFTFGGAVTTANTSATAVSLTDNGTSTINFTGPLTITTSGGTGFLATGGGTVTVQNASSTIDSDGQAINLNGVTVPAPGITFATTTSSGGASNVDLTSVGGTGVINLGGGTLTGATGTAFNVSGGTHNISYSGAITKTSAGRLVDFENYDDPGAGTSTATLSGNLSCTGSCTGIEAQNGNGSIAFSGGTKTLNTGTATAVNLVGNTNGTIDFTGGNLDIDTTSGGGFNATGGGTVTVQGSNNTITSATGTALNVANTTIGGGDLTFQRISANGGTNGIVLDSTGASGGLTVTGDGGSTNNGSGGLIQNTSGAAVLLDTTRDVSFDQLNLSSTGGSGVQGTAVTNFAHTNSTFTNTGNAFNESGIAFNDSDNVNTGVGDTGQGVGNNISGTLTVTGNTFTNPFYSGLDVQSNNGTVTSANVSNNIVTNPGFSGVNFVGTGTATTAFSLNDADITNNTVTGSGGNGIQISIGNGNTSASGAAAVAHAGLVTIDGSGRPVSDASNIISITGNAVSLDGNGTQAITVANIAASNAARTQTNFEIRNNGTAVSPLTGSLIGTVILIGNNGFADMAGVVDGNVLDANHTPGDAGGGGNGIGGGNGTGGIPGTPYTPRLSLVVTNNDITDTNGNGILLVGRSTASGKAYLKIASNTVDAPNNTGGSARDGIRVDAGNASSVDDEVYLNIFGNTSAGSNGATGIGIRKEGTVRTTNDFGLFDASGGPTLADNPSDAQAAAFVAALNPGSAGGATDIAGAENLFTRDLTLAPP